MTLLRLLEDMSPFRLSEFVIEGVCLVLSLLRNVFFLLCVEAALVLTSLSLSVHLRLFPLLDQLGSIP